MPGQYRLPPGLLARIPRWEQLLDELERDGLSERKVAALASANFFKNLIAETKLNWRNDHKSEVLT